ncbi:hypothetical protein, partial [Enterobacter kobei]
GWDARKRAYCLKIQPATGSFARNLIYSTKPPGSCKKVHARINITLLSENARPPFSDSTADSGSLPKKNPGIAGVRLSVF